MGIDTRSDNLLNKFKKTASEPLNWLYSAHVLKRGADALYVEIHKGWQTFLRYKYGEPKPPPEMFEQLQLNPTYMLLAGYALENLLKGLYVAKNPSIVKNGRLIKWPGSGHGIMKLIVLANERLDDAEKIELSKDEKVLLDKLEVSIVWAGRYPIPKNVEDLMPLHFKVSEKNQFNELFDRLAELLKKTRKGGQN